MLRLALVFLVVALIAAVLGFGMAVGVAMEAARLLFLVFLVLLVVGLLRGSTSSRPFREWW